MPVFKLSPIRNSRLAQGSRLESFVTLPRFLQAVPSLLVLTTAIAWGVSSHAGGLSIDAGLHGATGVTVAGGPALGAAAGAGTGVQAADGVAASGKR